MQDGNNEKNAPTRHRVPECPDGIGNMIVGSKIFIDGVPQTMRNGGLFVSSISSSRSPRLDPSQPTWSSSDQSHLFHKKS
ncbi:MAG: hypothetical protein P8J52_06860 [Gammaproteobacteria bacterium]|nr:hypothetical protein [Gammaproteobacteria bacterium]MDG2118889.1 hypothetical protein [Gammaproteobacteria bacterium]